MNKYSVIVGKFFPFHIGHQKLIEFALLNSKIVHVFIGDNKFEFINVKNRKIAIENLKLKNVIVHELIDLEEPKHLSEKDISKSWAKYIRKIMHNLGIYKFLVIGSDEYIPRYANYMGMEYKLFNSDRNLYPISVTKCRNNLFKNMNYIPFQMKKQLPIKICLVGAESVGKSTTVKLLKDTIPNSVMVNEYGRTFFENNKIIGDEWVIEDFIHINEIQHSMETYGLRNNNLVFCDTDTISTLIWGRRYLNDEIKYQNLKKILLSGYKTFNPAFIYILISPELIKWEKDNTRESENLRLSMHNDFLILLEELNLNFFCIDKYVLEANNNLTIQQIISDKIYFLLEQFNKEK